jgi:deoxyribonuclease (pyrimidine dimer)
MTRINVIPVEELTDQHLMAEYRELPMVMASARRSSVATFKPSTVYTLNRGHVIFFYDKKKYLMNRWLDLIAELHLRSFNIDPSQRKAHWKELDKFPQVDWAPDAHARHVNEARINEKIAMKPEWYRFYGKPLAKSNKN